MISPIFSRPRSIVSAVAFYPALFLVAWGATTYLRADTVALWLFDEPLGLYPSCVLGDAATNDCPLVLGPGGQVVEGKYGNALQPLEQTKKKLNKRARWVTMFVGLGS